MNGTLLIPIEDGRDEDELNYLWHDLIDRYGDFEQPFWDWRIEQEVER